MDVKILIFSLAIELITFAYQNPIFTMLFIAAIHIQWPDNFISGFCRRLFS